LVINGPDLCTDFNLTLFRYIGQTTEESSSSSEDSDNNKRLTNVVIALAILLIVAVITLVVALAMLLRLRSGAQSLIAEGAAKSHQNNL
jgi:hypothetical protein